MESTFTVPFRDYVADCWWLRGMVSICLIGKSEYDWFLHEYEGLFLDWLIFLLYLLQSVCCSKYSAKTTIFSILNPFLHFLHPFVLKYFRIFVTVPNAIGILYKADLDLDLQKKRTLYQNSLYEIKTHLRQIWGADFKYDNAFLKFLPKNTQIRHFWSQIHALSFFHEISQLINSKVLIPNMTIDF